MTLERIEAALSRDRLRVLGGFHPRPTDDLGAIRTLLLIGPDSGFWSHFTTAPEYRDTAADPLDRWSARVLSRLASRFDGLALFPFGGPPFHPFLSWARRTGRAWPSPVGLLVGEDEGLWLSYRGALGLYERIELPRAGTRPCDTCIDRPCSTACPVGALSSGGYDIDACRAHLETEAGRTCLTDGCQARAACPVSQSWAREPGQAAHHMAAFLG